MAASRTFGCLDGVYGAQGAWGCEDEEVGEGGQGKEERVDGCDGKIGRWTDLGTSRTCSRLFIFRALVGSAFE